MKVLLLINMVMAASRAKHTPTTHEIEFETATSETKLMVNTNDSVNFKCPASDKLKVYMVSERHYTNCEIEEDDKLILECTNSAVEPEDTEFRITSFSPQVDAFRFYPNREYYYVAQLNEGGCHSKVKMSVSRRKPPKTRPTPPKKETTSTTSSTTVKVTPEQSHTVFSAVKSPRSSTSTVSLSIVLLLVSLLFG